VVAVDIKHSGDWWQIHREALTLPRYDMGQITDASTAVSGCAEVYDLACPMGGIGWITKELYSCFAALQIQLATVRACIEWGVERYFYASSACVYNTNLQNDAHRSPLREADAYPAQPERGYGEAKLAGERLAEYARLDRDLDTRVARYHNVMGVPGSWNDGKEKAPAAICRKVAEAARSGDHTIQVWGDGSQRRSYLDVADCVDGTLAVMRSGWPDPMNIGSDRSITVDQLIGMAEQAAGVQVEKVYDLDQPQGVHARNADLTMVTDLTGWRPTIPNEQSITEIYKWIYDRLG
jgi:nucleoside-diphosphate-sugar epimerase